MTEQLRLIKQSAEVFQLHPSTDDDYHIVKGYATTYGNTDLVGDVIQKGAFKDSLKNGGDQIVLLWQHDHSIPVGKGVLQDSDHGVLITGQLPKNDDFVKNRLMPQLQLGSVKSFSIGMYVDRNAIERKKDINLITRAKIYETSVVTFAANPMAAITSVKSLLGNDVKTLPLADIDTPWDADVAIARVRKFTESESSPTAEYKKSFLCVDLDNRQDFTAYSIPFADVIDGELKAVPQALSVAVSAINGSKSIFSSYDLDSIKSVLSEYYKIMGKPDPFAQKQWVIEEVTKFTNKRDIENVLRESGLFSKSAAVYLASRFDVEQSEFANTQDQLQKSFEKELEQLAKFNFKD